MVKQPDFLEENREFAPDRITYGDESCLGKRKLARPFRQHGAIHLILKSELAKGARNLRTAKNQVAVARAELGGKSGRFWTQPPFTRLISGQRDYSAMLNYLQKNFIEAVFGQDARCEVEEVELQARKERRRKLAKSRRSARLQPNQ